MAVLTLDSGSEMAPGIGTSRRSTRFLGTQSSALDAQQMNASSGEELIPSVCAGRRSTRFLGTQASILGGQQINASSGEDNAPIVGASRRSTRSLGTHPPPPGTQQMNAFSGEDIAPIVGDSRRSTRSLGTHPPPPGTQQMNAFSGEDMAPGIGTSRRCARSSGEERRVRKRTVHNFLKQYKAVSSVKPRIIIEPGMTVPVGDWSQAWVTEVNIICRQNAPLSCHDWRTLSREDKRELFHERILESFDVDFHLEHVEDAVNKYLGNRFKDFRAKLHQHYLKQGDDPMVRRSKPYDGVTQQNWEKICDWFEDPIFKKKSEVNKANRKHQIVNHCAGSVSFARFKAQNDLGGIELYRQTHFSLKRSRWVDPLAHERHEAMVTRQSQATAENSAPSNEHDIVVEVLGEKRGYNRGLGHGYMPPSSSSARRGAVVEELQRNVADANRRLEEAELRNEEAERRNEELQRQVQALQSWQAQMESFMSQFGPGSSSCAE